MPLLRVLDSYTVVLLLLLVGPDRVDTISLAFGARIDEGGQEWFS